MPIDRSSDIELVAQHRTDDASYLRQWILWLGLGSAGAAATFLSLAANACDPAAAFRHLLISFWLFLLGIICAAVSLLAASLRSSALAGHYAATHNRQELNDAASAMPTVISSPQRIADEMNATQNRYLAQATQEHERAEHLWRMRSVWHVAVLALLATSAASFVIGVGLPLAYTSTGGDLLGTCTHVTRR
jgi:hypothetical protein